MRKNPVDVGIAGGGTAEDQAGDGARGVRAIFHHRVGNIFDDVATAIGFDRVDVHHGFAAVELLMNGRHPGIAEPEIAIARIQPDPVRLQRIERIFDLPKSTRRVRGRDRRKEAEAAGVIGPQLRRIVVALATDFPHFIGFAEQEPRSGDGEDRGGRAAAVHVFEILVELPSGNRSVEPAPAAAADPGARLVVRL